MSLLLVTEEAPAQSSSYKMFLLGVGCWVLALMQYLKN